MDIKLLQLLSGETIVAKVSQVEKLDPVEHTVTKILVNKPAIMVPTQKGMSLVPWPPLADEKVEEVELNPDHIMYIVDPMEEIVDSYKSMLSGIEIVKRPQIEV